MSDYKRADGSKRICRCECGGWVRGVEDFGRLWTYCTKCTPVQKIRLDPVTLKPVPAAR